MADAAERQRSAAPSAAGAATTWFERVPSRTAVSFAAGVLVAAAMLYAALAWRDPGWAAAVEFVAGVVALVTVLASPIRVGPALSLATIASLIGLEIASGRLSDGLRPLTLGLVFSLLTALFAAAYVRLGIRRRDNELGIAQAAIGELTRRDRITELLSGGHEPTWLESELARARRYHHQVSLVLIQPDGIDRFAEDGAAAVRVLEAVAQVIGNELRLTDVALRLDESTFSLILPQTPSDGARIAAERIRLFVPVGLADSGVTVAVGIAAFPDDASTNDELIRVAKRALERARELGGNRTICASVTAEAPPGWTLAGAGDP